MFALIFFVALIIGWALIVALPVWALWNLLLPPLFGLPEIGFWQALAIGILCSILFKR